MVKKEWIEKGYADEPVEEGTDLRKEIRRMCAEKNAVLLAHYYTPGEVQECADFIGDSLALARKAAATDADIIVMCGVHFMAETCKLLSPEKKVLAPDLNAGCSLADSCRAEDLKRFKEEPPRLQGGELCQHHSRGEGTHRCGSYERQREEGDRLFPKG